MLLAKTDKAPPPGKARRQRNKANHWQKK